MLTTVSDRKIGVYSGGSLTLPNDSVYAVVDYYEPHMISATDYYSFGMTSRQISNINGKENYRYGFNGKENDNEVKNFGNQQDYGMRIYDPRIGRFLSVDPISDDYPELTPYQFSSNSPIENIDIDGLEGTSKTKGSALWEGFKDGAYLTVTGHASNADNAPKFSVDQVGGRLGNFLARMKKIESFIPDVPVPGFELLKQATLLENNANQAFEVGYKAEQSEHSGWYIGGLVTEKVVESYVLKKVSGKAGRLFEGKTPAGQQVAATNVEANNNLNSKANINTPSSPSTSNTKPTEAYNRRKHYGSTPTKADRKALGAKVGEVVDHIISLVEHYYEGDGKGGKPGYDMTPKERRKFANDRSNMQRQSRSDSNKQGGEKSKYSKKKKKEHGL